MPVDEEAVRLLQEADPSVLRQSKYIADWGHFPVYRNTATKYYESGEAMFPDMLAALESAEHFIFLEYFIIEEGHMFHQIEDILEKKVKEGVEVRLIYDDVGCIGTLPPRYYKQLQKKGIKCAAFNPFRPLLSVIMNNRDHRKIFVVDGAVGFTGGINLADEYINEVKRFGYWKDTGVRIEGEAVWSLTSMFLSMWNYIVHSTEDYSRFMPAQHQKAPFENDGFVQPYGDSPLDHENVGENIYLIDIFICQIDPARKTDRAVHHKNLPVIPVVHDYREQRPERIKGSALDALFLKLLIIPRRQCADAADIIVDQAYLHALFDLFLQDILDLVEHMSLLDDEILQKNKVFRALQRCKHIREHRLPALIILCGGIPVDRKMSPVRNIF
jgi:phosphatidylserine/phosphatidylglycerophosphate/cardiolipin synthase-like enzyme